MQAKPDEIPTAGQVLRFRDGREGVVSSINSSGATVYVGPQAFMIPRGDWSAAFLDAMLASDAAAMTSAELSAARVLLECAGVSPVVAARVVPLPEPPPPPPPSSEREAMPAATELAPTIVGELVTPARESRSSRRDRKRQP